MKYVLLCTQGPTRSRLDRQSGYIHKSNVTVTVGAARTDPFTFVFSSDSSHVQSQTSILLGFSMNKASVLYRERSKTSKLISVMISKSKRSRHSGLRTPRLPCGQLTFCRICGAVVTFPCALLYSIFVTIIEVVERTCKCGEEAESKMEALLRLRASSVDEQRHEERMDAHEEECRKEKVTKALLRPEREQGWQKTATAAQRESGHPAATAALPWDTAFFWSRPRLDHPTAVPCQGRTAPREAEQHRPATAAHCSLSPERSACRRCNVMKSLLSADPRAAQKPVQKGYRALHLGAVKQS